MKARIPDEHSSACMKCKERLLNEYQYEVFSTLIDSAASSVLCIAIWALEMENKSAEEIKQFVQDFSFAAEMDHVFDKEMRVEDAMKKYSEKYDIDFDKIDFHHETKEHFMTRYRKEYENENRNT